MVILRAHTGAIGCMVLKLLEQLFWLYGPTVGPYSLTIPIGLLESHEVLSLQIVRNALASLTQAGLIMQPSRYVPTHVSQVRRQRVNLLHWGIRVETIYM